MPTEIGEASLDRLVRSFYAKVRADRVLGPIFEAAVEDWDHHFTTLTDFWSSVMLATGRYKGAPLIVHSRLPLAAEHFDIWLELWRATVRELFDGETAQALEAKAERIGASLRAGLLFRAELAGP